MRIGEMLRKGRLNMGLTQQEVADKIGVQVGSIANWEQGRCYPSANFFLSLVSLYKIEFEDFKWDNRANFCLCKQVWSLNGLGNIFSSCVSRG